MKKLILSGALILSLMMPSYASKTVADQIKPKPEIVNIIKDGKYDNHNGFVDESKFSLEEIANSVELVVHMTTYNVTYETMDGYIDTITIETGGMGTGIVIEQKDGKTYLITNNHVVADHEFDFSNPMVQPPGPIKRYMVEKVEDRVYIEKGWMEEFDAKVVATDSTLDIALLEVENTDNFKKFPYKIGKSRELELGDFVFGIGNPLGLKDYTLNGYISKKHYDTNPNWFMLDFEAQPGFSGGAIIGIKDGEYELVGVCVAGLIRYGVPPDQMADALAGYSIAIEIDPIMKLVNKYFDKQDGNPEKKNTGAEPIIIE